MTLILLIATIALTALLVRQHRKTRAAVETSTWWEAECKKHLDAAIGNGYLAEAETKRADKAEAATERLREMTAGWMCSLADDLNEADHLPRAKPPIADQSIPAAPWPPRKPFPVEPDGVLALGTVTPIKRVVRKS